MNRSIHGKTWEERENTDDLKLLSSARFGAGSGWQGVVAELERELRSSVRFAANRVTHYTRRADDSLFLENNSATIDDRL